LIIFDGMNRGTGRRDSFYSACFGLGNQAPSGFDYLMAYADAKKKCEASGAYGCGVEYGGLPFYECNDGRYEYNLPGMGVECLYIKYL
jgi:hypothetical protein